MATFDGDFIINEKSDEKGMLNVNALMNYLPKAKKAICEIDLTKGFGSGFFCKIPYTANNNILLPVLLTNNHVLSRDELNSMDYIIITIDGEGKAIPLNGRKKWTDEKIDFTCIEIREEEDDIHTFYNLDDSVFDNKYSNDYYLNKKVLIFAINQNDGKEVGLSNGIIIKNENCFFNYTCNTYPGCSGGCIVNQFNNCVIGIHKGGIKTKKNIGIYVKDVIKCIKDSKENKDSTKNLLLNVGKNYFNNLL